MLTANHTVPIRVTWVVCISALLLVLGACSPAQRVSSSSQHHGGTYSTQSTTAPTRPTPVSSSATPTSTNSPTPRPLASTPTVGSSSDSASGPTVLEQQIAQAVFQAINTDRASAGLPALAWSNSLMAGANAHSLLMSADDQLAHQLPGEPAIGPRVSQDSVKWTWCGENIGETSDTSAGGALQLHQMMMAEQPPNDGHRQNILSTHYTLVGIAMVIDSSQKLWLTEDFAN
jgi:uncharacterized protein YkwD